MNHQCIYIERDIAIILRERQIEARNARNLALWLQKYYHQPGKWIKAAGHESEYEIPTYVRRAAFGKARIPTSPSTSAEATTRE